MNNQPAWEIEGFSSKESQDAFHKWYFNATGGKYYWETNQSTKNKNIAIWEAGRMTERMFLINQIPNISKFLKSNATF